MTGARSIVGLDVGGTKTACVEGDFAGQILQRIEMPTHAMTPFAETFPAIADALGVEPTILPLSPTRIWSLLREMQRKEPAHETMRV